MNFSLLLLKIALPLIIFSIIISNIGGGGLAKSGSLDFLGKDIKVNSKQMNYKSGMKEAKSNFKSMGISLGS